jgi:bacterioferritin (cytochrome b1)
MNNKNYIEGVRMDYDSADFITRLTLIDSLKGINKNIAALEEKDDLKDHEKEDLEYDLKYRESLVVVIKYFSTADQMAEIEFGVDE